jgi:hypothetical protein
MVVTLFSVCGVVKASLMTPSVALAPGEIASTAASVR